MVLQPGFMSSLHLIWTLLPALETTWNSCGGMLHCDLSAREPMSSSVLAVWRSESSEELTAHYEVLCSDPAGLAAAIAIYAMFLEHRPSRSQWELLFQQRHVIVGCAQLLHDAYKYNILLAWSPAIKTV